MKNKKIAIIIILLMIVASVFIINTAYASSYAVPYTQKSVYEEKEDGWIYVFEILYEEGKNNRYIFDGYNLKYDELDGYYVPVVDKATGEILYKASTEYITLSISEKYGKDIEMISKYFNEKQFEKEITINDLKDLKTKHFDKEYLVNLFNKTINSEMKKEPGEYLDAHFNDKVVIESSNNEMPGKWQLSYLMEYGKIKHLNIEFISSSGEFLSDKVENISMEERELLNEIEILEQDIVESQIVPTQAENIKSYSTNEIDQSPISDLSKLLSKFEEELNA